MESLAREIPDAEGFRRGLQVQLKDASHVAGWVERVFEGGWIEMSTHSLESGLKLRTRFSYHRAEELSLLQTGKQK